MATIEDNYMKLEKLFMLYVKVSEIRADTRKVRPQYLNVYYFKIE